MAADGAGMGGRQAAIQPTTNALASPWGPEGPRRRLRRSSQPDGRSRLDSFFKTTALFAQMSWARGL